MGDTIHKQREFKTDGELYNESLIRKTKEEAFELYEKIIKEINMLGFITIIDVVCDISKLPMPKNWQYACTHGWTRKSVIQFTIRELEDKRWGVYLGSPHVLLNDV